MTTKAQQLRVLRDKILEVHRALPSSIGALSETAEVPPVAISLIEGISHPLYDNPHNDELDFLINLYNAISKTTGDLYEAVDLSTLDVSTKDVVNHYVNGTSKFDLPNFLLSNNLATEYFKEFAALNNKIEEMYIYDLRRQAAKDFYSQAYRTYQTEWVTNAEKDLLLNNLRATNAILSNPTEKQINDYLELADKTNKIGKWRGFVTAMVTLAAIILLAAAPVFGALAATGTLVMVIGAVLAPLSLFGASVTTAGLFVFNPFANSNRTRILGNDMKRLHNQVDIHTNGAHL